MLPRWLGERVLPRPGRARASAAHRLDGRGLAVGRGAIVAREGVTVEDISWSRAGRLK